MTMMATMMTQTMSTGRHIMEDTVNGKEILMMNKMFGRVNMMLLIQIGTLGGITVNCMVKTGTVLTIMDKIPNMKTLQVTRTTIMTDTTMETMMTTMATMMTTMTMMATMMTKMTMVVCQLKIL